MFGMSLSMGILSLLIAFITPAFSYDYGIDRISEPAFEAQLQNRNIAVLAHAASVDRNGSHLIDLLNRRFSLKKIFVPEHGLRSLNDGWVKDGVDDQTGLPVFSLYKERTRAPNPADLKDIDLVIIDLQDVGVRYYTYFSTIAEFIKVAASLQKEVMILDRPNPLGGLKVEGETLDAALEGAFISYFTVPTRHGLTLGELARFYVEEKKIPAKLTIIPVKDWHREPVIAHSDRPWKPSSPAILTREQVFLYALWGSLEHFNLSVGRGQTNELAFKVIAAPWISVAESQVLATELNAMGFKGLTFLPYSFTASRDVYLGQKVNGVLIELSEGYEELRTDEVTFAISSFLSSRYSETLKFSKFAVNYYGSERFLNSIRNASPWSEVTIQVDDRISSFLKRSQPYLLYSVF